MDNYTKLTGGSFEDNHEEIKKLNAQLAQSMNQRDQKLASKEVVFQMDQQIKKDLRAFENSIKQARDIVGEQLKSKQMQWHEAQRRKNILDEHFNRHQAFSEKLSKESPFKAPVQQVDLSQKSQVELTQMNKQAMEQQDKHIDQLLSTTDQLKDQTKQIGHALDEEKVIFRKLEDNVDQAVHEIKVTDSNLQSLLKYTNDCCLWTTILIESMIFIFLIIY